MLEIKDKKFMDSILGIIESTLIEGPIYFDCFPNFSIHLRDRSVIKSLIIDVKTHGFEMEEDKQFIPCF